MTPWRDTLAWLFDPGSVGGAAIYGLLLLLLAEGSWRALVWLVNGAVRRDRRGIIDATAARFFLQLARVAIYLLVLTAYFRIVPPLRTAGTVLLTGVSVASVIFALAAQTTLSNLIAGILLLVYFPFRVGDTVRCSAGGGAVSGTIESINLGYMLLRSSDGQAVIVPNSVVISSGIVVEKERTEGRRPLLEVPPP